MAIYGPSANKSGFKQHWKHLTNEQIQLKIEKYLEKIKWLDEILLKREMKKCQ